MTDNGSTPKTGRIDLNAARAARREKRGDTDPIEIEVGDDVYRLPDELPVGLLEGFARTQTGDWSGVGDAMRSLFGENYDELVAKHGLTLEDFELILTESMDRYGVPFESSAGSPTSSPDTSTPSKPSSSPSTASTSPKRSTATKNR